jgi:Protein of unknown function (DUF3455)
MRTLGFLATLLVVASPALADELVPAPAGTKLAFEAKGDGVQIYTCSAGWMLKAPEANLLDKQGQQIGTHFAGPTWKSSDGSSVVGELVSRANAPGNADGKAAIPWFLLNAKSHAGTGLMTPVIFIRRIETVGGVAPSDGCDSTHRGAEVRVPYSALYQFFTSK